MNKILSILWVLTALTALFLYVLLNGKDNEINTLKSQNLAVSGNNKILIEQLEKEHNDKMELSRKYEALEEKAKTDTAFDWYADISRSPVVLQLQSDKN